MSYDDHARLDLQGDAPVDVEVTGRVSGWFRGLKDRRLARGIAAGVAVVVGLTVAELAAAAPVQAAPVVAAASAAPAPKAKVESRPDEMSARITARSQGSRVEVESLRDEFSTTWVEPDGSLTTELHTGKIRFRDVDGS